MATSTLRPGNRTEPYMVEVCYCPCGAIVDKEVLDADTDTGWAQYGYGDGDFCEHCDEYLCKTEKALHDTLGCESFQERVLPFMRAVA